MSDTFGLDLMRSRRVHFRVPYPLFDELERLASEHGYSTLSAFMIGCCIIAVQNDRRHTWVREISNAKPGDQDFALSQMLGWPLDLNGMIKALKTLPATRRTKKP